MKNVFWLRRWKSPVTLGRIMCRNRKTTRTQNSRILRVCSALLQTGWRTFWRIGISQWSSDQVGKVEVCVYADSVQCVGQMRDPPEAVERWKGQLERIMVYPSYQDNVCIDGESIPTRLGEAEDPARELTERIIFMPMEHEWWELCFEWKKIHNCAKRFLDCHWTSLGPGSEEKWYGSSSHA